MRQMKRWVYKGERKRLLNRWVHDGLIVEAEERPNDSFEE